MHVAQVGGLLLSEEYWSNKLDCSGQTPPGYIALAGPIEQEGFAWCGARTSDQSLAYATDARETDFLTVNQEHHWTLLIPREIARDYLGEELVEKLPIVRRSLEVDPRLSRQLSSIVLNVLTSLRTNHVGRDRRFFETRSRARILAAASKLLLNATEFHFDEVGRSARSAAYRKARQLMESLNRTISVAELAKYAGVSRRTLEIAFKEATGFPPKAFIQSARLNAFYRELKHASPNTSTVTLAAQNWGFTELGRTAGIYNEMFGEYPSDTLKRGSGVSGPCFSDLLRESIH